MRTRMYAALLLAMTMLVANLAAPAAASGTIVDCPNPVAAAACFVKVDTNHDGMLDKQEFKAAFAAMSWLARWSLGTPEKYFGRCDQDDSGTITTFELLAADCIPCIEQRALFMQLC
jgi:hypothetical protein